MKKNNLTAEEELVQASMMGLENNLTPSTTQQQLAELMLEKMSEEFNETKRRKDIRRRQQESVAKEAMARRQQTLAEQAACSHRKQNGSTALAAMYNHQSELMGVCQNCGKEFLKNSIPTELLPDYNAIGGVGVR